MLQSVVVTCTLMAILSCHRQALYQAWPLLPWPLSQTPPYKCSRCKTPGSNLLQPPTIMATAAATAAVAPFPASPILVFQCLPKSYSPNPSDIAVTSRTSPALPCQKLQQVPAPAPVPPTPQVQPQQAQPYPPIFSQQFPFNSSHAPAPESILPSSSTTPLLPHPAASSTTPMLNSQGAIGRQGPGT